MPSKVHSPPSLRSAPAPPWVRWFPPIANTLRVNFDGATFRDIVKAGLGVLICYGQGHVLASLSQQIPLPQSSDVVEALAAARAISITLELGCSSVIVEGDSESVINTLNSAEESLSPFGHILASAKATAEAICCISLSHIRRLGNSVAYNLAKYVRHVRGFSVWMEDAPPHVNSILFNDNG